MGETESVAANTAWELASPVSLQSRRSSIRGRARLKDTRSTAQLRPYRLSPSFGQPARRGLDVHDHVASSCPSVTSLFAAMGDNEQLKSIATVVLHTGMRRGEIFNL